jgi:hypothetical protein
MVTDKKPEPKKKANKTSFKPGNCANPGGRPKKTKEDYDLIAACREKGQAALSVLLDIMQNGKMESNRIKAAQVIVERGYGKPEQPIVGAGGKDLIQSVTVSFINPNK